MEALATATFSGYRKFGKASVCRLMTVMLVTWVALSSGVSIATANTGTPAFITSHLSNPVMSGEGLYRWFGFRIYQARLWGSGAAVDAASPLARPLALQLTYARRFGGDDIAERSASEMRDMNAADDQSIAQWESLMRNLFPDINAGDHLTGITDANDFTHFFFNGKALRTVRDPAFTRAFFSIWLNEKTSAPGLRADLLRISPDMQ
jgi:hypothetical protein